MFATESPSARPVALERPSSASTTSPHPMDESGAPPPNERYTTPSHAAPPSEPYTSASSPYHPPKKLMQFMPLVVSTAALLLAL
eukprot:3426636-Prymnesium_polylepis.1